MNNKNNNSDYKTFCDFKYVKNLGNYNFAEKDSPFPIKDSSMTVPDGTAYFCFNENNVEYIVLKSEIKDVFLLMLTSTLMENASLLAMLSFTIQVTKIYTLIVFL